MGPTAIEGVPGVRGWLLRTLVNRQNPAGGVYGTVIVGALLAAESEHALSIWRDTGAILVAVSMFWLAHAYANGMGERIAQRQPFTLKSFGHSLLREWAVLSGAIIPLIATLVAYGLGASLVDALLWGMYVAAATLIAYEVVAGLEVGARGLVLLRQAVAGAVLGAMILLLHSVLA